eukprot:3777946-Pyramimonas_sp.AAC.1
MYYRNITGTAGPKSNHAVTPGASHYCPRQHQNWAGRGVGPEAGARSRRGALSAQGEVGGRRTGKRVQDEKLKT